MQSFTAVLVGNSLRVNVDIRAALEGVGWHVMEYADFQRSKGLRPDLIVAETASPALDQACSKCAWQGIPVVLTGGAARGQDEHSFTGPEPSRHLCEILPVLRKAARPGAFNEFIGSSEVARNMRSLLERVASSDCNVLITGETGTGKELVAELLHRNSPRSSRPFVSINCAAIPESLIESDLFGHERGAFTGAAATTDGKLKHADGGAAFLDEIGELSLHAQATLLRAIETRRIYRVGGHHQIPLDLRIIAATHQDLDNRVAAGNFRKDLYYRLNVVRIDVPPLRERRADIRSLLHHFVAHFNNGFSRNTIGFSEAILSKLVRYDWPGNVRELRNFVESTFVYSQERVFSWPDIAPHFLAIFRESPPLESERERIACSLEQNGWNRSRAASHLRISRMTLYRKITKYRISPPMGWYDA
jgi:DNA-binding NtrC family response regulator